MFQHFYLHYVVHNCAAKTFFNQRIMAFKTVVEMLVGGARSRKLLLLSKKVHTKLHV